MLSESYGRGYLFCTGLGYVPIFSTYLVTNFVTPLTRAFKPRSSVRSLFYLYCTLRKILTVPAGAPDASHKSQGACPEPSSATARQRALWPPYRFVTGSENALTQRLFADTFRHPSNKIRTPSGPSRPAHFSPETHQEPSSTEPALKCAFGKKKKEERRVQLEVEQIYRTRA